MSSFVEREKRSCIGCMVLITVVVGSLIAYLVVTSDRPSELENPEQIGNQVMGFALLLLLMIFYLLPFVLALQRGHPSILAVFALNLLLGWTLIGWIVALIWAFQREKRSS